MYGVGCRFPTVVRIRLSQPPAGLGLGLGLSLAIIVACVMKRVCMQHPVMQSDGAEEHCM